MNSRDTAISKKNLFFTVFEIYMQTFHMEKKNIFENFFFRLAENFSSYGFFAKNSGLSMFLGQNTSFFVTKKPTKPENSQKNPKTPTQALRDPPNTLNQVSGRSDKIWGS